MRKNFYRYVDRSGGMPQLRYRKWKSITHPYYVRYVNDKPVAYHGPIEIVGASGPPGKLWDYSVNEYVSVEGIRQE